MPSETAREMVPHTAMTAAVGLLAVRSRLPAQTPLHTHGAHFNAPPMVLRGVPRSTSTGLPPDNGTFRARPKPGAEGGLGGGAAAGGCTGASASSGPALAGPLSSIQARTEREAAQARFVPG